MVIFNVYRSVTQPSPRSSLRVSTSIFFCLHRVSLCATLKSVCRLDPIPPDIKYNKYNCIKLHGIDRIRSVYLMHMAGVTVWVNFTATLAGMYMETKVFCMIWHDVAVLCGLTFSK